MAILSRPHARCDLELIDIEDRKQTEELRRQRYICGWNYDDAAIENWRQEVRNGTKSFFWVIQDRQGDDSRRERERIGHVSLDSATTPPDLSLANPDKSLLTISTFFILPEKRSSGAGRAVMDILEDWATKEPYGSPKCKAIALNTLSRNYAEDDGPEWRGLYDAIVEEEKSTLVKGRATEDWYARRGYVKFKEAPKIPVKMKDGSMGKLVAVWMRKEL